MVFKGNGLKLKQCRFRLDVRRKFLTITETGLPREIVGSPPLEYLEVFKTRVDGSLSNLV